jgi:hypothetical protein
MCPLLDFVSNVVRGGKAKQWFGDEPAIGHNSELVQEIVRWVQMSEEDVMDWFYHLEYRPLLIQVRLGGDLGD